MALRTQSKKSKVSLNSVKSVAEKVPKTRACPWVAQWFTIPQAVVKVLQFVSSVHVHMIYVEHLPLNSLQSLSAPAVVLLLVWNSNGVTIADLDKDEINYRNMLYGYVFVGALSVVYSVGLTSIGLTGLKLPPMMVSLR